MAAEPSPPQEGKRDFKESVTSKLVLSSRYNGGEMLAQQGGHGGVGFMEQGFGQDLLEGGFEKGNGLRGVTLMDGLSADGVEQGAGLGIEGHAQSAGLAKDQGEEEVEGVDFALAFEPAGLTSQPAKGVGSEPFNKSIDIIHACILAE